MRKPFMPIFVIFALMPLNVFSQDAQKYFDKGMTCYESEMYEEALANLLKFTGLQPDEERGWLYLGHTYSQLKRYNEAIESFNKYKVISEDWNAYAWLGDCYRAIEDYENSLKCHLKYVELRPQEEEEGSDFSNLGMDYYSLQMYYDAIEQFKESVRINPMMDTYVGLCDSYIAIGEYDKARDVLTTINSDTTRKRDMDYLMGYTYVSQGKYEEAFKIMGKLTTLGFSYRVVNKGIKIQIVKQNGPADLAGLKAGDVVVQMNGVSLQNKTEDEVPCLLNLPKFGLKIKLKIDREGLLKERDLYVGVSPEIYRLAMNDPDLAKQREEVKRTASRIKWNIAVTELNVDGLPEEETSALTTRVRSELFKTCRFTVLERENMNALLDERGFQQTGATSDENLIEAGKLLNVEYVVGGSVNKIGETYSISLRMINVETGKIESMVTEDVKGSIDEVFLHGIKKTVYKLSGD